MHRVHAEAEDPLEAAEVVVRELGGTREPLAPMVPAVLVTRPEGLDHDLAHALREQGLAVITQPAIRFEAVPIDDRMRALLRALDQFDVVAFTSRHAVTTFVETTKQIGASLARIRSIAAVGQSTATELARHDLKTSMVGDGSGSVALADVLTNRIPPGSHVLHPGPAEPEVAFAEHLERARIRLTSLSLYQTRPVTDDPSLPPGAILAVIASPSAARSFVARPNVRTALTEKPVRLHLIAGGATTAAEIRRLGHSPLAIAESPSIHGVVPAVADALEKLARAAPEVPA
jgi:uroporphyrinogen-III synthase